MTSRVRNGELDANKPENKAKPTSTSKQSQQVGEGQFIDGFS